MRRGPVIPGHSLDPGSLLELHQNIGPSSITVSGFQVKTTEQFCLVLMYYSSEGTSQLSAVQEKRVGEDGRRGG